MGRGICMAMWCATGRRKSSSSNRMASQAALVGCGRSQANQGAHAQQGCGLARHSIAMRLLRKQGLPVVVCSQGEGGGGGDGSDAPSVKLYGKWQVEPYVAAAKDGKVGGSDA
eukprot:scaffold101301_cov15-Tisochrysis_lutea.AAC.2